MQAIIVRLCILQTSHVTNILTLLLSSGPASSKPTRCLDLGGNVPNEQIDYIFAPHANRFQRVRHCQSFRHDLTVALRTETIVNRIIMFAVNTGASCAMHMRAPDSLADPANVDRIVQSVSLK